MDRFYGFDLGDAESALTSLHKESTGQPQVLQIENEKSFITAYALLADGTVVIGEKACYEAQALTRKLRFKSRFLAEANAQEDIKAFAAAVLGKLRETNPSSPEEEECFYIGCPAGWNKTQRERYRQIFEKIQYPPARIISESRAALVSACQSRHLQVGYDILSHPVLVVDVGSSTTDLAYIAGGKEVELHTAGEVVLGGGLIDEELLACSLEKSSQAAQLREIFRQKEAWKSYCEFAARRLKERYFSDEEYWAGTTCSQTIPILAEGKRLGLTLAIDQDMAHHLLQDPLPSLGGKSFEEVFRKSLENARTVTGEKEPDLIFLTGGVSRMGIIKEWCSQVFPDAVVISSLEPEFSVAKGLAWCGRIDEDLRAFSRDVEDLKDSSTVERIVRSHIKELYMSVVESLTKPIMEEAAFPVMEEWRQGRIRRLCDIDQALQEAILAFLHTDRARDLMVAPVKSWLKPVSYELEEYTVPICTRHHVPYKALSLNSYLALSEIDIRIEAKNVFALEEATWMIDTIITLMVGLLCGGGGIALIANGFPGIIAGAVISVMVLFLGKDKMQDFLMKSVIPLPARRLMPKSYLESRLDKITASVKTDFYKSLEQDKNEEITDRLAQDISTQIDECLVRMAKVVEIPLTGQL